MNVLIALFAALAQGDLNSERLPAALIDEQQEDEQKQRPELPQAFGEQEAPFVDFDWMEMHPRIGLALFSDKYNVDPSPCFGIEFRAPIPFLAPPSNKHGEYFGLFAETHIALIERNIEPELDKPKGPIFMLTLGMDYTIFRNSTWLLLVKTGMQYASYGGITDLQDGFAPVVGLTTGFVLSSSVSFMLTPEFVYGDSGDYIILGLAGVAVAF